MWSFWLAFCNCDFLSGGCGIVILASSVCALMDEVKSLVRASWLERLTVGKQGLALVERAMISNILTQLSADGWGCALSPLVFWPEVTQPWNLQVTSKRTYDNMCLLCLPPPSSEGFLKKHQSSYLLNKLLRVLDVSYFNFGNILLLKTFPFIYSQKIHIFAMILTII